MFRYSALLILALAERVVLQTYPPDEVDKLTTTSLPKLREWLAKHSQGKCTLENAVRRKEWGDLTKPERKAYTDAVLCLQSKPALTSRQAPGAKSRFDDYIVVHIQQTPRNHASTFFLPWHRLYIHHYETALRTECNYTGYQPYWNWGRYASDPASSPLFSGDEYSLSGNGAYIPHPPIEFASSPPEWRYVPPGSGGGCVTTGPFANMSVNLGPLRPSLILPDIKPNPRADGLGYNPRCLRRDLNRNFAALMYSNYTYDLIMQNHDMYWFQTVLEGQLDQGKYGLHGAGHYTVSGDPAGDFYVSPGDPVFWLHHANIDRVWWLWQMQDLEKRLEDVSFTKTMWNKPPSENGTLEDVNNLGVLYGDVKTRDLMSTMGGIGGELCYIYE